MTLPGDTLLSIPARNNIDQMKRRFLHVGCGPHDKTAIAKGFNTPDWDEIRFDIDIGVKPDIVGTMTDMSNVTTGSMDAIYSAHNIEHLFPHEVLPALREFHRVLAPEGFVVITCPDIQTVCEAVADDKLFDPLYISTMGPISPIDILYGHRESVAKGNVYMAHKCGFTYSALEGGFSQAGFASTIGGQRRQAFDLWLLAYKNEVAENLLKENAALYLP